MVVVRNLSGAGWSGRISFGNPLREAYASLRAQGFCNLLGLTLQFAFVRRCGSASKVRL